VGLKLGFEINMELFSGKSGQLTSVANSLVKYVTCVSYVGNDYVISTLVPSRLAPPGVIKYPSIQPQAPTVLGGSHQLGINSLY
jgi:hypothetical protein